MSRIINADNSVVGKSSIHKVTLKMLLFQSALMDNYIEGLTREQSFPSFFSPSQEQPVTSLQKCCDDLNF